MSLNKQYNKIRKTNPYEEASIISRMTFTWVGPLIMHGYHKPLEASDIPWIPKEFSCQYTHKLFHHHWQKELQDNPTNPCVGRSLFRSFYGDIMFATFVFMPFVGIMLLQPYLVNDLLNYIGGGNDYSLGLHSGIGLAIILGLLSVSNGFFTNMSFYSLNRAGFAMKSAVIATIFTKSLKLSSAAKSKLTTGQIVTLISSDAERVWNGVLYMNWIWAGPIMVILAMALLIWEAGWAAVAAFAAMIIIAVFQSYIGVQIGVARKKQVKFTDERTKLINEVLQGIRIIKFYAWEKATGQRIQQLREREVHAITYFQYLKMVNAIMMFMAPLLIGFVLFIVYTKLNEPLSVAKVYKIYALLNVIRLPFSLTPLAWASWNESKTAFKRISDFMQLEEINYDKMLKNGESLVNTEVLIRFEDASFSWDPLSDRPTLENISLDIKRNDFIAVVGSVGSGKSSLIAAMLGQMVHQGGNAYGIGLTRTALVSQEHWIQNTDLKENVLFDSICDEFAYGKALNDSQLVQDLLVLPNADKTSIGERGLNLSGGQKARVSIARALYAGNNYEYASLNSVFERIQVPSIESGVDGSGDLEMVKLSLENDSIEMFVFDDSLASVDVHVGKALFEEAIQSDVAKKTCRVVSMSSNYHFLQQFNKIVVMEKGKIALVGDYDEIIEKFPDFNIKSDCRNDTLDEEFHINALGNPVIPLTNECMNRSSLDTGVNEVGNKYQMQLEALQKKRERAADIIREEDREKGAVALMTYVSYFSFLDPYVDDNIDSTLIGNKFRRGKDDDESQTCCRTSSIFGWLMVVFLLFQFCVSQMVRVYADLWMGLWAADVESSNNNAPHKEEFYSNWFVVLVWATVGLTILRCYTFVVSCLGATRNLHNILLRSVLRAPINTYFDVTPIGRILNRFSKDLDSMDALLPDFFLQTLQNGFAVLSILLVCLISSPYFVILFCPLGIGFFFIQLFYRKSSREMKRLDSVSRSPIFSLFGETLQGLSTIRAFGREHIFTQKFFLVVDQQFSNFFVFYMSSRWLALRLDIISNLIVLAVSVLSVVLVYSGNKIDPNLLGLALVYSLQLTALMQWTVRISIETETNMTSVERLLAFCDIKPEQETSSIAQRSSKGAPLSWNQLNELSWPCGGEIKFLNVQMRYRPELPFVLNCLNLSIPSGKRVGVCGRTGAGKSSLMLALFRIVECEEGSEIIVDNVNIRNIPLSQLRSCLTIIPQDPFMFSGTLRDNLDPFHVYSDTQIWEALARVHLKEDVLEKFSEKLQHKVSERGENISVGQRQLVCIARALLRNSKIIVMDEVSISGAI